MPNTPVPRRLRGFFLAIAALIVAATWAVAEDAGSPSKDPREAELVAIRSRIRSLQEQLQVVRKKETNLEERLQRVKVELELQEAQLKEASAALELSTVKVQAAESKVAELEAALEGIRQDLKRRLGGLARLGRHGYLRLFLALEPDDQLLPAVRQLRFLLQRDSLALERYEATRQELTDQRTRLLSEKRHADQWRAQEQARRDALVRVRRRHEGLIEQVARERRRLAQQTLELQDKERKLARLIGSLVEGTTLGLEGPPVQDFQGVLDWPARGDLIGKFGTRRDPRYRTEVPHNGIDLAVDEGTEVFSVFPGEVLYSDPFEGYGSMVVVHHPGRVFTLYAGMEELKVEKGDVVSLGDALGRASETLYFEVRVENKPEDPLRWLR